MSDSRYLRAGLPFAVGRAVEECGELCAALGKTLRWGWGSYNPELPPADREINADWVRREIADVRGALDTLEIEMRASGVSRGSAPSQEPFRDIRPAELPPIGSEWRHATGNGRYVVRAYVLIESTLSPGVVYEGDNAFVLDGRQWKGWVRPASEFMDGRFVPIVERAE